MSQVYVRFRHCADDHGLREHDVAVHVDRLIADGRQDGQADGEFHLQRLQRLVDPGCGKIRKKVSVRHGEADGLDRQLRAGSGQ